MSNENIKLQALQVLEVSKQLSITTQDDLIYASNYLRTVKATQKSIEEFFEPIKTKAYASYKEILNQMNTYVKPCEEAEKNIKKIIANYEMKQEALRKIEIARLEEENKKKAEILLQEAIEIKDDFEAQVKLAEAEIIATEKPIIEKEKVQGISYRVDYKITITDPKLVPAYIGEGCIRDINEMAIKKYVKFCDGNVTIPGIKITETKIVVSGK